MSSCLLSKFTEINYLNFKLANETVSNNSEKDNVTFGNLFYNSKYAWFANGATLKVVEIKTGQEISLWNFGCLLRDLTTKINCVEELSGTNNKYPFLIVGLRCILNRGMICIFEFTGSKVLRAIEIPYEVTSIGIINTGLNGCLLPGPLGTFDGAIAIGTTGGEIYLLDLCFELCKEVSNYENVQKETNLCQIMELSVADISHLESEKQHSNKQSQHLCICLNDTKNEERGVFVLKAPSGKEIAHVNREEVIVSALFYCPQLGAVLVGYNFGAWQLWNLTQVKLIYTSSIFEKNLPVTHFALQEPCDDPRAFCYIWVVYNNEESLSKGFPTTIMYALHFNTKEWHEGYGFLYEDLKSCASGFQRMLKLPVEKSVEVRGAQCLKLIAVNRGIAKLNCAIECNEEAYSYCFFIWNIWDTANTFHTFITLFDLNQWYKEQMPSFLENIEETDCSYFSSIRISDVIRNKKQSFFKTLDAVVNFASISQFKGVVPLEEHYFSSSVSYDALVLTESNVSLVKTRSSQRTLLYLMESEGPLCFIEPSELYQQCIKLGLTPSFTDPIPVSSASLEYQKEFILSVALEQQLMNWLCKCAFSSGNGSFSSIGFTLSSLLKWAWKRAHSLKKNADYLCVPLFDYSGVKLDSNSSKVLSNCIRQLKNLLIFFRYLLKKYKTLITDQEIILKQYNSLEMVTTYLQVIQWSSNVGLLPETPFSSTLNAQSPIKTLIEYYNSRRTNLNLLHRENFSCNDSILFIDNLIDVELNSFAVQQEWKNDGGNGFYPPPSLQSLIRTYLIANIPFEQKHSIIIYMFLDLAVNLDESYRSVTMQLIKFPAVFQLSPSTIKLIQAFWHLDHGDCSTAVEQLLDPLVQKDDLKVWHHRVALKSFLLQNHVNFALLYLQIRQPPVVEVQDVCTVMSLYIATNMLDEAFYFQRQHKNDLNEKMLMQHFFKDCSKKNNLLAVLQLPLSPSEESCFMKFLENVKYPHMEDFKTFYHLQRSRYMNAFRISRDMEALGLSKKQESGLREFAVKSTSDHMPEVSKSLSKFYQSQKPLLLENENNEKPLSMFINNKNHNKLYNSDFICATILKTSNVWSSSGTNDCDDNKLPFLKSPTTLKSTTCKNKRSAPTVIYPKEFALDNNQSFDSPVPSKKIKLFHRSPVHSPEKSSSSDFTLVTPVIKRKDMDNKSRSNVTDSIIVTPQSILKKRSNLSKYIDGDITPEKLSDTEEISALNNTEVLNSPYSPPKRYVVSPRKLTFNTPRPSVHFESKSRSSRYVQDEFQGSPKISKRKNDAKEFPKQEQLLMDQKLDVKTQILDDDENYARKGDLERDKYQKLDHFEVSNDAKFEKNSNSSSSPKLLSTPSRRRSYKDISEVPVRSSPRLRKSLRILDLSPSKSKENIAKEEIRKDSEEAKKSVIYEDKNLNEEKSPTLKDYFIKDSEISITQEVKEKYVENKISKHARYKINEENLSSTKIISKSFLEENEKLILNDQKLKNIQEDTRGGNDEESEKHISMVDIDVENEEVVSSNAIINSDIYVNLFKEESEFGDSLDLNLKIDEENENKIEIYDSKDTSDCSEVSDTRLLSRTEEESVIILDDSRETSNDSNTTKFSLESNSTLDSSKYKITTRKRSKSTETLEISSPLKRRLSLCEEDESGLKPSKRMLRSRSIDPEIIQSSATKNIKENKRKKRSSSFATLPKIQEENGDKITVPEKVKEKKEKVKSKLNEQVQHEVQEYSQSRRLTRRQKMLMEKNKEIKTMVNVADENKGSEDSIVGNEDVSSSEEAESVDALEKSEVKVPTTLTAKPKKTKSLQDQKSPTCKKSPGKRKKSKAASVIEFNTDSKVNVPRRRRLRSTSDLPKLEDFEDEANLKRRLRSRVKL